MNEHRSLKLDLSAIGLLAGVIFLALALLTYDPSDPVVELVSPFDRIFQPDQLVYPQHETVHNACGRWGALISAMLLTGLGVGAYYLVLALGIVDLMMLMRRQIDVPLVRILGWSMSLVGLTAIAAMILPGISPGPVIGSGGYLGALTAGLLEMHFATPGGLVIASSFIVSGLLLSTDYALLKLAYLLMVMIIAGVTGSRNLVKTRIDKRHDAAGGGESGGVVRIRGQAAAEDEDAEEEYEEEEYWEDDEESDEDSADEAEEEDLEQEREQEVVVRGPSSRPKTAQATKSGPRIKRRQEKTERQEVMQSLDEASLNSDAEDYELPSPELLIEADEICFEAQAKEVRRKAKILERTFANFGFQVKVVEIETGPVIAQYEVQLEAGLRLSRITGLADDLAIALRVPSVRIVAPIPGKNTVGIEVPNEMRQVVRLREVMEATNGKIRKMKIPLFLGKDVSGNPLTVDLASLPHLLIAGRTGTGKSVCLNAIITSILMTRRPDEVRMLMVDPKMVELSGYGRLPHLMHPVVTDMRKAEAILAWAVEKMEERYALLARAGVRHITSYNQLGKEKLVERLQPETEEQEAAIPEHLPFIVIVADEIADLMMTAGKEVEQHIIRLAQKSRAVGIHLILATQKPTVDVITGLIKSNLPARLSFQVASRTDSRVVLDEMGADKLLGNGDMLFLWPGTSMLLRGQGTYLSDDEIETVVEHVSTGEQNFVNELVNMKVDAPDDEKDPAELRKRDELYESAIDVVVRERRGSVSLLQRTLGIGYGRAARLIDFMAEDGIVGEYNGSQAREVLLSPDDWDRMQGQEQATSEAVVAPPPKPRRSNVILPDGDWEDDDAAESKGARTIDADDVQPVPEAERDVVFEEVDEDVADTLDEEQDYDDEELEEDESDELEEDDDSELTDDEEEEFEYVDEDEYDEEETEEDEYAEDEYEEEEVGESEPDDEYEAYDEGEEEYESDDEDEAEDEDSDEEYEYEYEYEDDEQYDEDELEDELDEDEYEYVVEDDEQQAAT
jgi:S-DNA-T family DNA segregation ATPase FtsK/SpoIIIE